MIFEEKNKHNFEKFLKFTKKKQSFYCARYFSNPRAPRCETQKIPFA